MIYSNIGGAYQIMVNYEQALLYFQKAEQLAIQTNDQDGVGSVYVSLSDIALYQGKPLRESVDYAEKALEIFQRTGNMLDITRIPPPILNKMPPL